MSSFDIQGGELGKREGMARADEAAAAEWKAFILIAIREIARRKPILTTDDVERYRLDHDGPTTHEHRALGPRMMEAAHLGLIVATQDWVESRQRINHRRPMRVWLSLIYNGNRPIRYRRRRLLDPNQYDFNL